jgi:uncharacterized protein HemX
MSFMGRFEKDGFGKTRQGIDPTARLDSRVADETQEPALDAVLANFRASVTAWSDAELGRTRAPLKTVRQRSWRLAAGWALGCVLVAGGVGGGFHQHQQKLQVARMAAAARAAEQQRVIAEQRAREEEDLLANVDSDVSREVPSAMEPLAQLMSDDESK